MVMLSLKERTVRYPLVESRATVALVGRPSRLKLWDEDYMKKAYEAVMSKQLSIRRAAETYSVPKSTLADRVSGHVKFGSHSGPERYLDDKEESQLVRFIIGSSKMGYAKTKMEIMLIAEELIANKGKEIKLSNGWWESFHKRHPSLTLRSAVAEKGQKINVFVIIYCLSSDHHFFLHPSAIQAWLPKEQER